MKLSIGLWDAISSDAAAFRGLVRTPEIWEMQRTDGADMEETCARDYGKSILGIWRDEDAVCGFSMYVGISNGVYEQHVGFLEAWRGGKAATAIRGATDHLFLHTDAIHIVAPCPDFNPAAGAITALCGGSPRFRAKSVYRRDGVMHGAVYFGRTFSEWIWESHLNYKDAAKDIIAPVDVEECHQGMVGLAVSLARNQPEKAVMAYNAFAAISGNRPGKLVWREKDLTIIELSGIRLYISDQKIQHIFPCQ